MTTKRRRVGRPLKGKTPVRSLTQLAIRLSPSLEKDWHVVVKQFPNRTQSEIFEIMLNCTLDRM